MPIQALSDSEILMNLPLKLEKSKHKWQLISDKQDISQPQDTSQLGETAAIT